MLRATIILLSAATFLAAQPAEEAVEKEVKLFQGKWEALSGQSFDGTQLTDVEAQLTSLEVDGDKFTLKTGSLTVNGTFSLDPSKKLKTIDVFLGDSKENVLRGIYVSNGDVRKSCFAAPGKDRPTEFRKEKGFMIMEWRQVK
jgi:uncharacterized protein (TIGR03067 family)